MGYCETIADIRQFIPAHSLFCMDLLWIVRRKIKGQKIAESFPWYCRSGGGEWMLLQERHNPSSLRTKALSL